MASNLTDRVLEQAVFTDDDETAEIRARLAALDAERATLQGGVSKRLKLSRCVLEYRNLNRGLFFVDLPGLSGNGGCLVH